MNITVILTATHVDSVFRDCLFQDGEDTSDYVKAEGIVTMVGFHPERLASHRQDIVDMLAELPDQFKANKGGGWSFLNMCEDRHGRPWTGSHQTMEQLLLLGLASELVKYLLPRDAWPSLSGGMPWMVIK